MKTSREVLLEMSMATVGRLSGYSFAAKGWAVTLAAALAGVAISSKEGSLFVAAAMPIVFFWALDAYYLMLERRFRHLFAVAYRSAEDVSLQLSLDHRSAATEHSYSAAFFSVPLIAFYGAMALSLTLLPLIL